MNLQKILQDLINKFNILKYTPPKKLTPKVERMAHELLEKMTSLGQHVTVFQGYRSIEEQNKLYEQGRTRPGGKVTNAKGGESLHNYGVAVDVVFLKNGKPSWAEEHPWKLLGETGKSLGFDWGGDWVGLVDRPHFNLLNGKTLADFQNRKIDYTTYL